MSNVVSWIKMMWRGDRDSSAQYDLRGEARVLRTARGWPTMSFGYWRDVPEGAPDALGAAVAASFGLVAETAGLGPGDRVLDAGCGFGTNAVFVVERFGVRKVVGLNVSDVQLAFGRELSAREGLSGRIDLCRGSASAMPFEGGTFDKVISVEAAFHFPTRRQFFAEAFRVLSPGGTLALVDLVPPRPRTPLERAHIGLLCRALQVPRENVYGLDEYRRHVADAGFVEVELRSIREHVLPAYQRWILGRPAQGLWGLGPALLVSSAPFFQYPWDYVCLRAVKPSN